MKKYYELENAEPIKIGQKIKTKITKWNKGLIPATEAISHDMQIQGVSSVRIYVVPKYHDFLDGDEIFGNVKSFSVASNLARDGRKKIYINLINLRRAYSFFTNQYGDELTVMLQCGKNVLEIKKFQLPQVAGVYTAPKVGVKAQAVISASGTPRMEPVERDDEVDGGRSIRIYQLPDGHRFKKDELIKGTVESVSVGHGLAMGKRKKIFIALREPRRVYSYRIDTTGNYLSIRLFCGSRLARTKTVRIQTERCEAIYGDTIYAVTKLISKRDGRLLRMHCSAITSVESLVKQKFADLRAVLPSANSEHLRRLRKSIRALPQLEKDPRQDGQYDFFAERDRKRHRPHETQII